MIIERAHFLELQKQALVLKDQEQNQKVETTFVREQRGVELDNMRSKEEILKSHKDWRLLFIVLSQKCHSKLLCGSENAKPQEPFTDREILEAHRQFDT